LVRQSPDGVKELLEAVKEVLDAVKEPNNMLKCLVLSNNSLHSLTLITKKLLKWQTTLFQQMTVTF